jgi:hypothetical protein
VRLSGLKLSHDAPDVYVSESLGCAEVARLECYGVLTLELAPCEFLGTSLRMRLASTA